MAWQTALAGWIARIASPSELGEVWRVGMGDCLSNPWVSALLTAGGPVGTPKSMRAVRRSTALNHMLDMKDDLTFVACRASAGVAVAPVLHSWVDEPRSAKSGQRPCVQFINNPST